MVVRVLLVVWVLVVVRVLLVAWVLVVVRVLSELVGVLVQMPVLAPLVLAAGPAAHCTSTCPPRVLPDVPVHLPTLSSSPSTSGGDGHPASHVRTGGWSRCPPCRTS